MKKFILFIILLSCMICVNIGNAQSVTDQSVQKQNKYYHSVRACAMAGGNDGSNLQAIGVYYYLRSYKEFSLIPAVGFTFLNNSGGNAYASFSNRAIAIETNLGANLQIARVLHLKITPHLGLQATPNRILNYGVSIGTGISLWKVDFDFDLGVQQYFDMGYVIGKLSLGYVFSQNRKLIP